MTDKNKTSEIVETATFAGGCFWCTETAFQGIDGVKNVTSGYIGGNVEHPTYRQVTSGSTGHLEAVQVLFHPDIISYTDLLKLFFKQIDPTDAVGSFVDRGSQYKSAVFYHDDLQKKAALNMIEQIQDAGIFQKKVSTRVIEAGAFYEAEDYHQGYHKKNPVRYKLYRAGSGRDQFIERTWKVHGQILD